MSVSNDNTASDDDKCERKTSATKSIRCAARRSLLLGRCYFRVRAPLKLDFERLCFFARSIGRDFYNLCVREHAAKSISCAKQVASCSGARLWCATPGPNYALWRLWARNVSLVVAALRAQIALAGHIARVRARDQPTATSLGLARALPEQV